jgi:cellulose synthase/poly-beta-1,6-N-acetylglucosamine synthase-like glycosyltransferase
MAGKCPESTQADGLQQYRYPAYLPHAGGSTIGLRRHLWNMVGGFDESLRYLEDTDLCWKLQLAGVKLHFVPEAVIHVRLPHSLRGIYQQARAWGAYNVILYQRYLPFGMPKLSPKLGLMAWGEIIRSIPRLFRMDEKARASFMWNIAWRFGRLEASVKHRVFAL